MNTFITSENKPDYANYILIGQLLNREITTTDDYSKWVADWRQLHTELVNAIKFFRALKNISKSEKDGMASTYWYYKKRLGAQAHRMYQIRTHNKKLLKSNQFTELETA